MHNTSFMSPTARCVKLVDVNQLQVLHPPSHIPHHTHNLQQLSIHTFQLCDGHRFPRISQIIQVLEDRIDIF